jgi:hypothetical protein
LIQDILKKENLDQRSHVDPANLKHTAWISAVALIQAILENCLDQRSRIDPGNLKNACIKAVALIQAVFQKAAWVSTVTLIQAVFERLPGSTQSR